jgi:surface antigen
VVLTGVAVGLVGNPPAVAGIDDYPAAWRPPTPMDSKLDTWRYVNRECTSFVAWRLHARNHFEMPPAIGDANQWAGWARNHGIAVNRTPAVGSVASRIRGNHVAWVDAVHPNGMVTIEEYNHNLDGTYSNRTVARDSSGHLSRGFREWLLSFRQFADDRIAEKCYVAVSQWKRQTAVPAILRLEVGTVRGHFWDWLDGYSRLDSGTVRETKATVTAALHDSDQTVEHIVSTIIETFLALPRSDECVSQIVRIGQHDGQPNAFAVSRAALLVNQQPPD